jgi:hypothetical protein
VLKLSQLFLLVILFFFVSKSANAGLLIEPLGAFNFASQGKLKDKDHNKSFSAFGGGYGGRLGYQNFGFQLGVDYLHSSLNTSDSNFKKNISLDEWAGFVGFQFPILLRVYAGYIFSASGTSKYDNGNIVGNSGVQDFKAKSGSGAKFGIGFTGLPFVAINLEYRRGSIDSYKIGNASYDSDPLKYSSYLLSLSIPINI